MDRLGIDIGSKTIKLVLLDGGDGSVVYSDYLRHRSMVKRNLIPTLKECLWRFGDREIGITVTGSAGMRVAELFDVPFVQEVVCLKRAVEEKLPNVDAILEMGGEDTKLVYLTGTPEQRMNNVCAGGTGGFIDMMAGMMGVGAEQFQRLAMGATTIYPIASRCAVFAKSDVRPLLNAGAKREDVAASVLRAVATQAVAGLSAGRPLEGRVALLGGPFRYIPALRDAFCQVTGKKPDEAIVPDDAELYVAYGAARSDECSSPCRLSEFVALVSRADFASEDGIKHLSPLFDSEDDYCDFKIRHDSCKIPRANLVDTGGNLFLGIDAGSTTMKVALIDESGRLVSYLYDWNQGDVTESLPGMLQQLYRELGQRWVGEKVLRRSCIVGYGEGFCKTAYRIDTSEVETVAHLRAARELVPDVDFLMDIGGQDIKCFYVRDGVIEDIVLNEACSSGCGSLFDSVARSMRRTKEGFAKEALFARAPVDLGTRCSTFMDSRIKHAQKDGAAPGDIAAGVCYATARNALYKVVRQPDFSKVGTRVVVQGGAFANDALLRAFELETGVNATRPDLSELMGAWGAALLARDEWLALKGGDPSAAACARSTLLSHEELDQLRVRTNSERCGLCGNNCNLVVTNFDGEGGARDERAFVTGNRCERGAAARNGSQSGKPLPPDMIRVKNALLDAYAVRDVARGKDTIGIPQGLLLYDSLPFWKTLFSELGLEVITSGPVDESLYREGMSSIPSEGACYPFKLLFGQCADLVGRGARILFVPSMGQRFSREGLLGIPFDASERTCPLIEHAPDVLSASICDEALGGARLCLPDFTGCSGVDGVSAIVQKALADTGIEAGRDEVRRAIARAQEEYRGFFAKLEKSNARVLAMIDSGRFPGALLLGHSYHADPGIGHGIDELLGELGYAVIERTDYSFSEPAQSGARTDDDGRSWTSNRELLDSVRKSFSHPNLQVIIPRSFGCGIDALAADIVHDEIRRHGRLYAELKIDQITDLAAVRIRLRSLAYATAQRGGSMFAKVLDDSWSFMPKEEARRIEAVWSQKALSNLPDDGRESRTLQAEPLGTATSHAPRISIREGFAPNGGFAGCHSDELRTMWKLGLRLAGYDDSAGESLQVDDAHLIFVGKHEVIEFESWTEVNSYVRGRLEAIDKQEKLVGTMGEFGYSFIQFRPQFGGQQHCIGFVKSGTYLWFANWDEVDEWIETHGELSRLPLEQRLVQTGQPQMPPAPGAVDSGERFEIEGAWGDANSWAQGLLHQGRDLDEATREGAFQEDASSAARSGVSLGSWLQHDERTGTDYRVIMGTHGSPGRLPIPSDLPADVVAPGLPQRGE